MTSEEKRTEHHITRLALLASVLENGATGYDWLSKEGGDKVDLSGVVDKEKRIDKWLKMRMNEAHNTNIG